MDMKNVRTVTTDWGQKKFWEEQAQEVSCRPDAMHMVRVYPELLEQRIEGFGGAFTEASAVSFWELSPEAREELLEGYFGEGGLRYVLGRVHMNSCDFGLGNYAYVEEGDEDLHSFDISHDREQIIPLVKKAMERAGAEGFGILVSPWSPPAYMKTNGEMNHGGKLLERYRKLWADYYVKYLLELKKEGLPVKYLTVQNEPEAVQTWDSCIYTAQEEGEFVVDFLKPALEAAGLGEIEIFIWDHNKENMYHRAKGSFQVPGCRDAVSGVAMHWYTGDHFEAVEAVKKAFPEQRIFFTEGCVEYSRFADSGEVQKAQMYAHDILGNLKAGMEAYFDWNLLLNVQGGPNHVGNFCAAPIMCDGKGGIEKRLSYYYIGQFSRYVMPGARRVTASCYTAGLETVVFVNPDGSRAAVLLNTTEKAIPVCLTEEGECVYVNVGGNTICTVIYE
jgi:glucosylceramidase